MSKFKVGDEVNITSLVQFGDEPNEFNVCLGDTGEVVGFWNQSKNFAIVENKKFKGSRAGWGKVYVPISHIELTGYKTSNRNKLREHIKSLGFTAIDLSVAAGFSKYYFGSETGESRFNKRGDISNDRLNKLSVLASIAKTKLSKKSIGKLTIDLEVKTTFDQLVEKSNNRDIYAEIDESRIEMQKSLKSKWIVSNKVFFTFLFIVSLLILFIVTGVVKQVF